MNENPEGERVNKYLNKKIEPPQQETPINPILKNPNSLYRDRFLEDREVVTPFFIFSGNFIPLQVPSFIDNVVETTKRRLELEGKTEAAVDGALFGTRIGLELRLGGDNIPLQLTRPFRVEGNQEKLDLLSLLPDGYQVVWVPDGAIERSANDLMGELLIVSGDITSPEGLLTFIHEIGHYCDLITDPARKAALPKIQANMVAPKPEELKNLDPEVAASFMKYFQPVTSSDIKLFLESERNAWAFALKALSRLTDNKEVLFACKEYIHRQPLRLQAQILRSRGLID